MDYSDVRETAARLLAAGFTPKRVSLALTRHLSPSNNENSAYRKLRRWMHTDAKFRDMVYEQAVIRMDLQSPDILNGVVKAAKRGRVDAARLALEISGRHTQSDAPVTQIAVVLNNLPRPGKDSAQLEGPKE
jgi:hypothetical protein